jgi:putative tricarboxylic transport membrane protein
VHKNILRNGDVISAAVLAALGVYVFIEARGWAFVSADGPGPGFFPAWYGAAMVVLSLALIATTIAKPRAADAYDWPAIGRALGLWLVFAVSAALMGWLGFLVCFAILTFFVVAVVFRETLAKAALAAVGTAAGFYVVFTLALSVPLPTGVFGF